MEKKDSKKKTAVRRVIYINGSCYICLPARYVERYGIKPGDEMALILGNPLQIVPMDKKES
jgi:bifunctional DNA-binding transcriptional regulator/antitoxin component of YhaV-PrlF toxin-antitoxin module